jgi:transporter family protein
MWGTSVCFAKREMWRILSREAIQMKGTHMSWQAWALLSAVFAALTAILAKVGVQNINSDFATFVRTIVVLLALAAILGVTGQYQRLDSVPLRSYLFLILSGLATGASWVCYFRALKLGNASLVAPIDKLSVVLVALLGVMFLGEKLLLRNWAGIILIAIGAVLVGLKP